MLNFNKISWGLILTLIFSDIISIGASAMTSINNQNETAAAYDNRISNSDEDINLTEEEIFHQTPSNLKHYIAEGFLFGTTVLGVLYSIYFGKKFKDLKNNLPEIGSSPKLDVDAPDDKSTIQQELQKTKEELSAANRFLEPLLAHTMGYKLLRPPNNSDLSTFGQTTRYFNNANPNEYLRNKFLFFKKCIDGAKGAGIDIMNFLKSNDRIVFEKVFGGKILKLECKNLFTVFVSQTDKTNKTDEFVNIICIEHSELSNNNTDNFVGFLDVLLFHDDFDFNVCNHFAQGNSDALNINAQVRDCINEANFCEDFNSFYQELGKLKALNLSTRFYFA